MVQDGERIPFTVHAPITGKTWEFAGDARQATLEGVRDAAIEGARRAVPAERELGWDVPVAELADWARGMRAARPARIEFRSDGLPALIEQAGWTVEYPDYDEGRSAAAAEQGVRRARALTRCVWPSRMDIA